MADGKTHSTMSVLVGLSGAGVGYTLLHQPIDACGWFALGGLAAVLLSPDLDCPAGNISIALIRKLPVGRFIAKVLSLIWEAYWIPYRWLVGTFTRRTPGVGDSHRSWLSHLPVIGTALRLAWLLWLPWLVWGWFIPPLPLLYALVACDVAHSILDSVQW